MSTPPDWVYYIIIAVFVGVAVWAVRGGLQALRRHRREEAQYQAWEQLYHAEIAADVARIKRRRERRIAEDAVTIRDTRAGTPTRAIEVTRPTAPPKKVEKSS